MYNSGRYGRENKDEALRWYKRAAESGDAEAQYKLAEIYLRENNCNEAVKIFELVAAQGNTYAMLKIGDIYKYGQDGCLKQSDAKVIEWYTRAAEGGNMFAQSYLGEMYGDGKYVKQNDAEAVKWFRLAAA